MRPTTKTTNLTPARTDLIGRDLEMARVREMFREGRLVTITGIGGTGKTRLAREFGQAAVPDFPGGVWLVELAKFDGVDEALRELSEMLGLGFGGAPSTVAPIVEALRNKPKTLIVLDNLEHLIEQIADPISRILDSTKDVCVLATSREPIRIAGEQRFKLTPLGHEAAVRLFERRAAEVIPSFAIDDTNREAIEELVDKLDRLPLAIELAASRINVLPPAQLIDRITTRMRALRAKDRDRPARHETLQATIEWSWELLDEQQRVGLAQCSAFRGGFTLQAMDAVVDHEGYAEDLAEDLVERSLMEFEDTDHGRRFYLFEMVRSSAEAKLEESGRAPAVFDRHASHYIDLIESTPPQRIYSEQAELPNLLVAMRRVQDTDRKAAVAIAAARVLRLSAGVSLVEDTLSELVGQVSDKATVGRLLFFRAVALYERGDDDRAYEDSRQAIETALEVDDTATAADAHTILGLALTRRGEAEAGQTALQKALELAREDGNPRLETTALGNLAITASEVGKFDEAERLFGEALACSRRAKDDVLIGRSLMNVAVCLLIQRRWQEALTNLEESLEYHEKVGDDRFRGLAYNALGKVKANLGDVEGAAEAYTLGQEFAHALGNREAETSALIGLGELGRSQGDRTYLVKAVQLNEGGARWQDEAKARSHLAVHDLIGRRHELARPQFRRAIALIGDRGKRWSGLLWGYLALSYAMTQDMQPAEEALDQLRESWAEDESLSGVDASLFATLAELVSYGSNANPADVAAFRKRLADLKEADADWGRRAPQWADHDPLETIGAVAEATFGPASVNRLAISRDGRRFTPPGGEEVDFSRRGPLRKIIVALATARVDNPGEGLSPDDVLEAGWPGDVVTADAGAARVYSAVRTLRTNGLEEVLLTQDDGYLIDPDIAILWLD